MGVYKVRVYEGVKGEDHGYRVYGTCVRELGIDYTHYVKKAEMPKILLDKIAVLDLVDRGEPVRGVGEWVFIDNSRALKCYNLLVTSTDIKNFKGE